MNHSLERIRTPSGDFRYELRAWGRAKGDIRRRLKTKDEALVCIETLYKEENSRAVKQDNPLFQSEFDYWLAHRGKSFAPGHRKNIDSFWLAYSERFKWLRVSEVTKSFVRELEHELLATGNSQKTVNDKIGIIQAVLNNSIKEDRITTHQLKGLQKTKSLKVEMKFWLSEEAASFLECMNYRYRDERRWVYVAYLLALNTGMRASEIWGLSWSQLMHKEGIIFVTRQFDITSQTFRETKGKDARYVPLSDELWRELAALNKKRYPHDLVFNFKGLPICHRAFQRRFERDQKVWCGQLITFHEIRHTSATLMLQSGASLMNVKTILGHKSISTTERYLHAVKREVGDVSKTFSVSPSVRTVSQ